jgi:hypothetical protein
MATTKITISHVGLVPATKPNEIRVGPARTTAR